MSKEKNKKLLNFFSKKGLTAIALAGVVAFIPIMIACCFAGVNGANGKSAYEIALEYGFVGTEAEWLESLKGSNGHSSYTHIKYAESLPDEDSDILTTGTGDYVGIYTGTSANAPSSYTAYTWYKIKGETGETGPQGEIGNTPTINFDEEGYIVINGVKSDICIFGTDIEYDFNYNSTTLLNYEFKVLQGNALGRPETNRVSLWFDYKFKAGTTFKLIGDLTTYNAGFSISRDGIEFDARTTTMAEDSGWITSATETADLNIGISSLKHHYDATTKTLTLKKDSYVRMNFKNTESSSGTNLTPSTYDWKNFVEINGKYKTSY